MKSTWARVLAGSAAVLAMSAVLTAPAVLAAPAAGAALAAGAGPAAGAAPGGVPAVVLIGIPGLRWSDITPAVTPALWRLAEAGSVGSLAVTAVDTLTCPADAWLTLNSGARAIDPHPAAGPCPGLPAVVPEAGSTSPAGAAGPTGAVPAAVPAMPGLIRANRQFSYQGDWGLLGRAPAGQCATAIGPGAAIALASPSGQVASYLPGPGRTGRFAVYSCALTVADLGALPAPAAGSAGGARGLALRAADQAAARVMAQVPAGAIVVVAGLGDDGTAHLRAIIVSGPGYRAGLLAAASTRQRGLVQITDLTRSVLTWLGRKVPAALVGAPITSVRRGTLTGSVRALIGQDTAAQVYTATLAPFLALYAGLEIAVFGLIALLLRGSAEAARRRRRGYRIAGVTAGAVPAATFLASLAPWPLLAHPAVVLYGLALAWAVLIAAAALTGPWRRDPFGPPGFVGAVTVAVIGLDVSTGSHLQLGTPFGLSVLDAGRFYGVGNNALGVYGTAGILCATWAAIAVLRRSEAGRGRGRGRAAAAAGAVALLVVVASGWPGFGAKVGGTIAMVPAFLLLLAAVAGLRITLPRAAIIAVSGLLLITAFAVINYLLPGTGPSDIGAFVGHVLHGGAGSILHRKVSSNLHSLTENWLAPVVPVVAVVTGAMLAWPARLGLRTLDRALRRVALLRPALTALWLAAVLGWLAEDSGVSVMAAAMPIALPLVIVLVTGIAADSDDQVPELPHRPGLLPHQAGRANL